MKQTILNGISHLADLLKDSKKVFLVCDSSYPFLNIKEDIEALNFPHVKFSGFSPNPLYEDVCKGIDTFHITKCDTLLAVGGGSAIDVAKCIKLAVLAKEGNNAIIPPLVNTRIECDGSKLPFIAIPTTAGTGSESTRYAVIYYEGMKQSVTNKNIIPDVAILEPKVLKTLPLYQKKCTMLDALCQGIESWWSVNSTEKSKELSKETVETIMKWWHEYIFENTDISAQHIMHAANLAGQAICITQTTAAHAFSYKITSLFGLPHGHAVAICLPEIWEYMISHMDMCIESRGCDYFERIINHISKAMGCSNPRSAINTFRLMLTEMQMVSPISNNYSSDFLELCSSVNPIRLRNNPTRLDDAAIMDIYKSIVK